MFETIDLEFGLTWDYKIYSKVSVDFNNVANCCWLNGVFKATRSFHQSIYVYNRNVVCPYTVAVKPRTESVPYTGAAEAVSVQ